MESDIKQFKESISKVVSDLKGEFASLRGSRPTVKLVEDIKVNAYSQESMSVKQLGSITLSPPREIDISVWDASVTPAVAKAVGESLGVNPNIEGTLIRVNLPSLTDERRRDIIRSIGKIAEDARVKIRSLRDGINKNIEQSSVSGNISEDDKFNYKEDVQKAVTEANESIANILKLKTAELSE